jgi:ribonuclease BN (tRNA processing enzyme)
MIKIRVLGCGDAIASGGRHTTSFAIVNGSDVDLIDCGVSTLVRLKQEGIDPSTIQRIFLSHFHGDHFGGVPFVLLQRKITNGNNSPLAIYGPKGVEKKVRDLQECLYPGTAEWWSEANLSFIEYTNDWQEDAEISLKAFSVTHSVPSSPHGLKFRMGNICFAFSGDSEWDEQLIELAAGTDFFICECNNYMNESAGHLSYQTILAKADLLRSKKIYLTHMGDEMLAAENIQFEQLSDGLEISF